MAFIRAVIDFMPHESRAPKRNTGRRSARSAAPAGAAARPVGDSGRRSAHAEIGRSVPDPRGNGFVRQIVPHLPAIEEFIASFGKDPPEEVCAWGDLAQAAIKAKIMLAE